MNFFENLWGALQIGGTLLASPLLRKWYNRWGVTVDEAGRALPGDELVPVTQMISTRAIVIHAPAQTVWSWLVQIGQGRGGLYSYDGLENLAGCNIHSVDRIFPELQHLQPGDLIRLGPPGYPCYSVNAVEAGRSLVLVSADLKSGEPVVYTADQAKAFSIGTWQFILEPLGADTTRLFSRQRLAHSPDMAWIWRLTEPISFVMERRMLRGIKQRAERPA